MKDILLKTAEALKKHNMEAFCTETKEEALEVLKSLLKEGDVVGHGGSVSLSDIGAIELLKSGKYTYLDRSACQTQEERDKCMREMLFADVFLSGANAVTEDGVIYNVDGNGNRVAAICFGPERVIIIAGVNKIVPDFQSAIKRVKTVAAPKNAARLNTDTYCFVKGECAGTDGNICDGCFGSGRICCQYVATGYQRNKDRIKVILVNEEIGY